MAPRTASRSGSTRCWRSEAEKPELRRLFEPVGCDRCGGAGYRGRRAIFEVVDITEPMRRLIVGGAGDGDIELAARSDGMATMLEDGLAKAMAGMTSVEEVFRVASVR